MLCLPPRFAAVILAFAPVFVQQRTWRHAEALLVGAILAPGRRTVTSLLRVVGLGRERCFVNYHRVLNRAVWSSRAAWLWCTIPIAGVARWPEAFSGDALGHRHAEAGHPVEHRTSGPGLGLLSRQGAGTKAAADHTLVAEHRRFRVRSSAIADCPLPAYASLVLDQLDMLVALTR
jgi:hypothetical protein